MATLPDPIDHRAEADRLMRQGYSLGGEPSATEHLLAGIHDLLEGLPHAIVKAADEYATAAGDLLDKGDPCLCGCERDADPRPESCCGTCPPLARGGYDCTCKGNPRCEPSNESHGVQCEADAGGLLPCPCVLPSGHGGLHACKCSLLDPDEYPEPGPVTVTLLGRAVEAARYAAMAARESGNLAYGNRMESVADDLADAVDALADALDAANTLPEATSAPLTASGHSEAPGDGEGAERPTGANLRIWGTWLVRDVGHCTCSPYGSSHEPGCGLEPEVDLATLPGWPRVLSEGQVAVAMLPGWRGSTPADWRKEAEILRKERPDALAAAALCEQFADALDGEQS